MHLHARTVFVPNNLARWGCVLLLSVAYAFALAHGVASVDVARDLHWRQQSVRGEAFALLGPPLGSTALLDPVWYCLPALMTIVARPR